MKHFTAILFLLIFSHAFPETIVPDSISKRAERRSGPKYIGLETGIGSSSFRDLATSPLFYSGFPVHFQLSFLKEKSTVQRRFDLHYAFGPYRSEGTFYNTSRGNSFFADYSKLWAIQSWNSGKWSYFAGGTAALTTSIRNNPSLQNNAIGLDFFGNLMGNFQVRRDLSRKTPDAKKLWFIRYGRKPKERDLTFNFGAGLLNMNYRNGFVYTQQYQVVNEFDYFENYEFHVSGLRFTTRLAFTRYFNTGNAMRFSYNWDAYRTSYRLQASEMAHHSLTFALLFRTR